MTELIWDGKYDKDGRRVAPVRIALPFQTIETVNESGAVRAHNLNLWSQGKPTEWRNRLIWGDKKYVLPSLLPELAGKVNLIYIDPPFATGADFSFTTTIPETDDDITKEPSMIEQKAYRDMWGQGLDSYLQWFSETVILLHDLLAETGTIYVHLDWHISYYVKTVMDEVFGSANFLNHVTWHYYNKMAPVSKVFPRASDQVLSYAKSFGHHTFNKQEELREEPVRQLKRKFVGGKPINVRDEHGNVEYQMKTTRRLDDVWRISMLQPADKTEYVGYATQKPEALLERIIRASSNEGDLVLDCFCGSGTTAAVAEKLGRRWITADLGRFAISTTRKRLLSIPNVRPFVVQNLGKYERQQWQVAEFGQGDERQAAGAQLAYRRFMLDLYRAQPLEDGIWLHGLRDGHFVHVGSVDAPVALGDVQQIVREVWKIRPLPAFGSPLPAQGPPASASPLPAGRGAGGEDLRTNAVDILGWDFAFELNEVARQMAAENNVRVHFKRIPREVLEKRAVEQGDIKFFELAALSVTVSQRDREGLSGVEREHGPSVTLTLADYVVPPDDIPEDVQRAVKHWSQWIDYWAVDWDYQGDTFHNMAQTYRTRKDPKLQPNLAHTYAQPGSYTVVVKVIDILGNDTTKTLRVSVGPHP